MAAGTLTGDIEGNDWTMRWHAPLAGSWMERRPIVSPPEKDGLYFVDFGTARQPGTSSAALLIDGVWCKTNRQPFKAKVTHWTRIIGEADDKA